MTIAFVVLVSYTDKKIKLLDQQFYKLVVDYPIENANKNDLSQLRAIKVEKRLIYYRVNFVLARFVNVHCNQALKTVIGILK